MQIKVRFFASLRERLGDDERALILPEGATVAQVWEQVADGASVRPGQVLAARNMEYVDFGTPLAEGDEVAFFPPVTGGAS